MGAVTEYPTDTGSIRIANVSGFYGDRNTAPDELLAAAPDVDVLTGDYLAELTMYILHKTRSRAPHVGYARTFLSQMERTLGTCLDRGVRVVANAGGLDPAGLASALQELADGLGLSPRIAYVTGDNVVAELDGWLEEGFELRHLDTGLPLEEVRGRIVTANAYLGGWGIARALEDGADVVICPRVSDASLVVGPAAAAFGWAHDDWDRLAGAVVAGHVIECGCQATGGNYRFFDEIGTLDRLSFPIAEVSPDGSSVITKPSGTEGIVTVGTVTAQLLYEIGPPEYPNPDVVARFDTIRLEQVGPDRVWLHDVRGLPAPSHVKIAINNDGGYRNEMTLVLTGPEIEAKADLARRALERQWGDERPDVVEFDLWRTDRSNPQRNEEGHALLRVTAKSPDRTLVDRAFSDAFVQIALSSYPGLFLGTPPTRAEQYGVYWPTLVPAELVGHHVTLPTGEAIDVPRPPATPQTRADVKPEIAPGSGARHESMTLPVLFGNVYGTRSGDKAGNANLGVWARSAGHYDWLASELTVDTLKQLLPDLKDYHIARSEFPNLWAVNFVIHQLLGEGVASSARFDRQAKSLGEYLAMREVLLPIDLANRPAEPDTVG